ncbi:ectoine hydroxylase [Telmatospirillum sp. J64-1]|uniref:ectoine hydroxylase n=1 Tax=Telmatospirillum sp. J64-1 TaxID=2502183 RepID=UPI002104E780|nr:ectoine hydroxylase [Telmatospirillum sp. J64-1]
MDRMVDIYPSRIYDRPRLIDRQDPVVYPGRSGPLTADQLAFFEENGYLFLPAFFDEEETARLVDEVNRLCREKAGSTEPEVIREAGGDDVRSIFAIHQSDPVFASLCRDDRLAGVSAQILGSDVYVHQSRINYKPGFRGKEFYWHSDFETWHVEDGLPRMRTVSCSLALSENNPFNGPLMVVPGSHKTYVSCVGATPEQNYTQSLVRQEVGVPDDETMTELVRRHGLVQPTGPAGSVLIFDCNVIHGSGSNISPYPRSNAFFVYNSVENLPVAPFGPETPRPGFLGSRDFTVVNRQP